MPSKHDLPASEPLLLDYQSALPEQRRIQCELLSDGLKLTVPLPSTGRMWQEVLLNFLMMAGLTFGLMKLVLLTHAQWGKWIVEVQAVVLGCNLVGVVVWLYFLADSWQNVGVVTVIEVSGGYLMWDRHRPWHTRVIRWPADQITHVRVIANGLLRVHRRNGFPLGAFGRCSSEELKWAASALREALHLHQLES